MEEVREKIKAAQTDAQMFEAGNLMRAHVEKHPEDKEVLLSEFRRKSMRMVNTKRLTTNF